MLLEELITSRVRARLLTLFMVHPDEEYHLKGLVRLLGENNNGIRVELNRLERLGLLISTRQYGRKLYSANKESAVYPELRGLVLKTSGVRQVLRDSVSRLGVLQQALLYGSFARDSERADSDIDLLLVGYVDPGELRRALREAEGLLGRDINEILYDPEEFQRLRDEEGSFVRRVFAGPTIDLYGGRPCRSLTSSAMASSGATAPLRRMRNRP